ncbi:MAG TPA: permease prefix domain 2-containing transporter [Vicinamibacterales bacterium]
MTSHPPSWAQSLLAVIVPARNRDGITGDLLEEYHEVQLPRRGERAADVWYLRQVLLFLWRAARWWGLALGALIVVRDAMDVYVPTSDYYIRSAWTTYTSAAIYAGCGLRAGWSYGRTLSGTAIGIAAAVIASIVGLLSPLLFLTAISARAELWEVLDVPAPILLVFGAVLGTLGAAIGSAAGGRWLRGARA